LEKARVLVESSNRSDSLRVPPLLCCVISGCVKQGAATVFGHDVFADRFAWLADGVRHHNAAMEFVLK
jgi:hypothetical protein